jgi:pimeloyl-ACP methyl ester carboxylesterase
MSLAQRLAIKYIRTKFKIISSFSKQRAARAAFRLFCSPQSRVRKELPAVFEEAEKLSFLFEGKQLSGYRWNHPSDEKLLILHGFESSVINFDRFVAPLIEQGYEILAFDAPAHGRSEGKQINVLSYRDMIVALCKEYGPVSSFLSHSFGGLSLSLALEIIPHDERFRAVFIAPAAETTTAIINFFHFLHLDPQLRAPFEKVIRDIGGYPSSWFSLTRAADHIKAKVLFIQDKDDDMTPYADVVPLMNKRLPNFQFLITEGLGHRKIYRDNNVMAAVFDFFNRA